MKLLLKYTKNFAKERGISKARVIFLRSLLHPTHSFQWIKFIDEYYKNFGFECAPWTLIGLPMRSYVTSKMGISKKISLLINHYNNLSEFLPKNLLTKILAGEVVEICKLTAKNGDIYGLNIAMLDRYWREGGLTIFMTDAENEIITTITFNFGKKENGEIFAIIGGLQGTASGKATIVSSTRALNGLRPKYAVLEALYAFSSIFNVESVVATSLANHVFMNTKIMKKMHSDYDQFWMEIGGVKGGDKNFQLPKTLPKRSIEEVQSKRKKDWLKRQEYLEQIKIAAQSIGKLHTTSLY